MATIEQLKAEISTAEAEIAQAKPAADAAEAVAKQAQDAVNAFLARPDNLSFTTYNRTKKYAAENPNDPVAQKAAQDVQATWNAQQSEYLPLLKARDDTWAAKVAANKPIVAAEERAAQADLAIAKIDPSQASQDARDALAEQQGTPAKQPSEGALATTSAGDTVKADGTTEPQATSTPAPVTDNNPRRVTSVEVSNGQTTRYYSDGSSETDTEDGRTLLDDGSGSVVEKTDPGEDPTNGNAGQKDYSNNGDQVPYDQGEFAGLDKAIADQKAMDAADAADLFYTGSVSARGSGLPKEKPTPAKAEWKEAKDLRAILRVPPNYITSVTDPGKVLKDFGGIIFPYTPQISMEHSATYNGINPLHSNYTQYFYKNSAVSAINVTGKFTVQNEQEGMILLGVVHLLRALTKMKFGPDKDSGAPPPVCRFQAYGDYMLQNVPVVVASFRQDLPDGIDYFAVGRKNSSMGPNLVPIISTITVTLNPVYSRSEQMAAGVDNWLKGSDRAKGYL